MERQLTPSTVVCSTIQDKVYISPIHNGSMSHSIFLVSVGIEDCYVQVPHTGDGIKNHLVTPKVPLQKCPAIGLVCQRSSIRGCGLLKPIVGLKSNVFIEPHPLSVLNQPDHYLAMEVSHRIVWVIWMILVPDPK